ncbi:MULTISPECIES: hypothetical protein [unclassified Streptomyces]|uniref:hypothetical protein n=1 Tax=unclassified Streptomyces TaxID=2593676 RepID=UPI000BE47B55|nr:MULTISPECIES: hypothetical protein [unclassified Streptomyces]
MCGASDVDQRAVVEADTGLNGDVGELRSGEVALLEPDVAEFGVPVCLAQEVGRADFLRVQAIARR